MDPPSVSLLARDEESGAVCIRCTVSGQTEWRFEHSAPRSSLKTPPEARVFPSQFKNFDYCPSPDGTDANLLVMFHGLGDSPTPFTKLGKQFSLPQTALLALRAPFALPLELGYGWFECIDLAKGDFIQPQRGEKRRVQSLQRCLAELDKVLEVLLTCGWAHRELFLFGYSQGGTVAMEWTLHGHKAFGGVVAVAAGLVEERQWSELWPPESFDSNVPTASSSTEIPASSVDCLIIAGHRDTTVSPRWAKKSALLWGDAAEVAFFDKKHDMLRSPEEAKAVMTFFGSRLVRISAWEQDPDVHLIGAGGENGGAFVNRIT